MTAQAEAPAVPELLTSKGVEVRRENSEGSRWYVDVDGLELNSVTTVLSATTSKPWLTAWAAKLAAEFAVEQHEHIGKTIELAGAEAAIGMVKGAAEQRRNDARDRGTFVHDIVEALILDTPLPEFTDDVAPYADAFVDWCIAWQPRFLAAEATVARPEHGWAGTLDVIAYLPALGRTLVIDCKTGANLDRDMIVQLGTYQRATEVWLPLGRKVRMPETAGCAVLHIRPGRARLVELTELADDAAYGEFLTRLDLLRRFDATPKQLGTVRYPLNPDGTPGSPWLEDLQGIPLVSLLAEHGVITLADLCGCTAAQVRALKGFGPKKVALLEAVLAAHGLAFKEA